MPLDGGLYNGIYETVKLGNAMAMKLDVMMEERRRIGLVMGLRGGDTGRLPHERGHVDHAVQLDTTQCTGHGPVLHAREAERAAQTLPPCSGAVATLRLRDCVLSPQVVPHADHSVHCVSTQSTGHAPSLHDRVRWSTGQLTPPSAGCVVIVRSCFCVPLPHDLVQVDQVPYGDTAQSTGHGWELQVSVSFSAGHT